jgi:hypothetical protein
VIPSPSPVFCLFGLCCIPDRSAARSGAGIFSQWPSHTHQSYMPFCLLYFAVSRSVRCVAPPFRTKLLFQFMRSQSLDTSDRARYMFVQLCCLTRPHSHTFIQFQSCATVQRQSCILSPFVTLFAPIWFDLKSMAQCISYVAYGSRHGACVIIGVRTKSAPGRTAMLTL